MNYPSIKEGDLVRYIRHGKDYKTIVELQGGLVGGKWVCGDCYNCDGRTGDSTYDYKHCFNVIKSETTELAKQIEALQEKIKNYSEMHERACSDIQEYSETIEAQAKEIEGLKKVQKEITDKLQEIKVIKPYGFTDYNEAVEHGYDIAIDRAIDEVKTILAKEQK